MKGGTYTDRSLCHSTIPPIGQRFFPNKPTARPCGETDLETRAHILIECPRITKDRIASQVPSSFSSLLPTRPPLRFQPENPPERNAYKKTYHYHSDHEIPRYDKIMIIGAFFGLSYRWIRWSVVDLVTSNRIGAVVKV